MCLRAWIIVSAQTQDDREILSNRYDEILNNVQSRNNPSKYIIILYLICKNNTNIFIKSRLLNLS